MKKIFLLVLLLCAGLFGFTQTRNINKLTLETTYTMVEINKSLRDLIDQGDKSSYFDDDYFNTLLKTILTDSKWSEKEKVQLFYLMQKKLGYAFVGINYLPPKHNFYMFHVSETYTWLKTKSTLKSLNYNINKLIELVDSNLTKDAIIASNALLLATILNPDSISKKLEYYLNSKTILTSKSPNIFNHYVCMSASLYQNPAIVSSLTKNILAFQDACLIEDAICALYSKNNPVGFIKEYFLSEKKQRNALALQTALCVLEKKVPPATFEKSVKSFYSESKEKWKKELCKNILDKKVTLNYSLSNNEQIVTKTWENVTLSLYTDGALISNYTLLEFDPN
jgi:hypothetical protein